MSLASPSSSITGHILPIAPARPRHQLMELRDRVALVTGAGRRLGRAFARALAGRGMAVAIHHNTSAAGADELRREILAEGGRAACFAADLSDAAAAVELPGEWRRSSVGSTCSSTRRR